MKKYFLFLICLLCIGLQTVFAQNVINVTKSGIIPTTGIDPKTVDTLLRTVNRTFQDFQKACTLIDPKAGQVTQVSIDRFNDFFEFNADVPKDYIFTDQVPEIKSPDYSAFVVREISGGLSTRFISAEFTNINMDALGFYRVFVRAVKQIKNGLDENGEYALRDSCLRIQFFTFFVEKKDMEHAKINLIKNSGELICFDPPHKWPISVVGSVFYGQGSSQYGSNEFWPGLDSMRTIFSGKMIPVWGFSGAIHYRFKNRPLELFAGAQYSRLKTNISLDSFNYYLKQGLIDSLDPGGVTQYRRKVTITDLTESGTIQTWQLPIGITWWTMERNRFSLGFSFGVTPGRVVFYKSQTNARLAYASSYNFVTSEGRGVQVTIKDKLPGFSYLVGPNYQLADSLQRALKYKSSALFLGLQFSPVIEWQFTEHINLRIGAYFHVSLTNWFKSAEQPNTAPFGFGPSDIQSSVLSEYTERFRVNHIGLQAGLRYKL